MSAAGRLVEPPSRRVGRATGTTLAATWLLLPLVPLVLWALADRWTFPDLLPGRWGFSGWTAAAGQGVLPAMVRSALLGTAVAALATPAGALAGWALARRGVAGGRLVAAVLLLPVALPPFAVVMGLGSVALRLRVPTEVSVIVVLTVAALPYTTYVMRAAYSAYDHGYDEEARSLGATPRAVLLRVHLPLVAPALAAAAFLAFLVAWSDYIVTLLLGGGSLVTVPILVGSLASASGNDATVAAVSVAAVLPPVLALVLTARFARRGTRP